MTAAIARTPAPALTASPRDFDLPVGIPALPAVDDWDSFSRGLFRPHDLDATCPKIWESSVAIALHRLGYSVDQARSVLTHAELWQTVQFCPALLSRDVDAIEGLLPEVPDSWWEHVRFAGFRAELGAGAEF